METVPLGFLFLSFPGIYLRIFFVFIFQFSFKHLNNKQSYFLLLKIPYIYTYIFLPWVTKVNKVKNQIYIPPAVLLIRILIALLQGHS